MPKEEFKAWMAEIDLAKPESLPILHKALCEPLPRGSTRVDRRKRKFLRRLVNKRIRQWDRRAAIRGVDPWNDPLIIGGHIMPPLSHRYGP